MQVLVVNVQFMIGKNKEALINVCQFILIQLIAQSFQVKFQRMTTAAGSQYNSSTWKAYIFRTDDLVILAVFEETVLVDTRAVREGVAANDSLVGLNRHTHLLAHHAAHLVNFGG